MSLPEHLVPEFEPVAAEEAVVTGPNCRFTVLTGRLLRQSHEHTPPRLSQKTAGSAPDAIGV